MLSAINENFGASLLPATVYQRCSQLIAEELYRDISSINQKEAIERTLEILEECLFLNMGRVLIPDTSGKYLRIKYSHGLPTEKRFITYKISEGISGFVYTSGEAIYIDDLETNSMYQGRLINPIDLPYSKPAFSGVPIKSPAGKTIGVLCVNHGYRNAEEVKLSLSTLTDAARMISRLLLN